MIRKAFVMAVNPDAHAEYQRRHTPIWPELESVLKAHGAHHYSIFLDETRNLLFGVVEIESEERWNAVLKPPSVNAGGNIWLMSCQATRITAL